MVPSYEPIRVEWFERYDGAVVIHLDATNIVVFVYPEGNNLTLDVHHRTDDAHHRLRLLLDGQLVLPRP